MEYYVFGKINKVYYGTTSDEEKAKQWLKDAKEHHPQEDWEIKTKEQS